MKVIISGGELFNKGAQSMTLSVVSEVRKRYPDAEIALLSAPDARRSATELQSYRFSVLPWDLRMKLRKFPLAGLFIKNKYFSAEQEKRMWQTVEQADLAIDVSGFCLSSQFGTARIVDYLTNLFFFKKSGVKTVLFPQSFGPFAFQGKFAGLLIRYTKKLMQYPDKIFAREVDGQKHLKLLGIEKNVSVALDTVLQTSKLENELVFNDIPQNKLPELANNSVCIVPNQKVYVKNKGNSLTALYQGLIEQLLAAGKTVYLLRHSFEDLDIITQLKALFADDDRVVTLGNDFNALELTAIINQSQFLIASRYHAVVHAYKCRKPCLVLGWAVKYQELTQHFEQQQYCFDVRENMAVEQIDKALAFLLEHYQAESDKLNTCAQRLKLGTLFDEAFSVV
ncbi:polysaccharide pyruvyl transferase family protein [Planctobacterium marinum]|uniref:Polysaccharide pyruvyl transferase domain-containing protein n=1 Tax=Planctobacterium marinum TaxID=1631968 RepID=A0AA48KQD3_9ALTE|nr:hypothetical protein MACH26_31720 [Planctobacterium marinum]